MVERKTPQEVLHEQAEEMMLETEKVKTLFGKKDVICTKPTSSRLTQTARGAA